MQNTFSTRTFGKWILAGEHAVLRGCPALVFPLKSKSLQMKFVPQSSGLELDIAGEFGQEFRILFWSLLEKACAQADFSVQTISGKIHFQSDIPIGSGLGASAALCVAIARWFSSENKIKADYEYEFSRNLENIFHGESSGVDVAVVLSEAGLHFERSGVMRQLKTAWSPIWGISDSGQKGMTYDCIRQVKDLWQSNPIVAEAIDLQMQRASELCERSLLEHLPSSLPNLAEGIEMAKNCFQDWGLVTDSAQQLMTTLKKSGALATKPTGSGGGGYILSLWDRPWPEHLNSRIISCVV